MPRLLLIDDESRVARALEFAFPQEMEIVSSADAAGAVGTATTVRPDLILLDIALGGASGLQVCRDLKADDRTRSIPVIVLSGQTDAVTKAEAFAAGAGDFVPKPFVPTELMARIDAQLRRSEARG
ncbi:MAG TPA: response regulator transcription factor [Chloroflexota bacterium]|nr:response regulator transcription factor [Chloroflexota bacterium]